MFARPLRVPADPSPSPNHRHCHPTVDSGTPVLPTLPTPVLPVVFWPAGLHWPSGFLSGSVRPALSALYLRFLSFSGLEKAS
ncbi:hypothetical protein M404DRAFT_18681 [Pisolithus tinctorius Marx 270]|uniref:Uncharacterized protein n=1 Tax=Pisolithus tinctorius Marx 270 TaxID=870435 RepID=A0A0C3PV90_PISTI|nr:hypothetical protein M404DRAFT_18681 [Pisolithus tinctorius Marx 270]